MRWRNQVRETPNSNDDHNRCRVLIVDDTRGIRVLLKESLGRWGIQTEEAVDGMPAWELLQHESFDIVISDYEMPRCSGLQLLVAMRHSLSSITKRLPLILVSSARCVPSSVHRIPLRSMRSLTKRRQAPSITPDAIG